MPTAVYLLGIDVGAIACKAASIAG